jgi:coenzyme PQQ synthesis protein D (PqqD)
MTITLRDGVHLTTFPDGAVLLDTRTGRYWQLNTTAALLLQALLEGASVQQASRQLAERHPQLSPDQAGHDLDGLLEQLRDAGLVTP